MTGAAQLDDEARYRAIQSRDARFDGWFFVAVTTTGIFCRPSCPATTPRRDRVHFYPSAAAAHQAGYRACRRCRPDTAPGSPEWNQRADLAGRAMRFINDGVIDREGVPGLASRLAVSERHLTRVLTEELGAGPLALARARRAQTARVLIETTGLPFTQIAFAAGFASIRQFNDTVRATFGASPSVLRADRTTSTRRGRNRADLVSAPGRSSPSSDTMAAAGLPVPITLRLATREPFAGRAVIAFLATRAVPGLEAVDDGGAYTRVLRLPHGYATVALAAAADHVVARLQLTDLRDLGPSVERCRRLLDLDADPASVDAQFAADPILAPLVKAVPGRRSPGAVDGTELLVRAVLGQQVSVAGARTLAGRLVAGFGVPLPSGLAADGPDGLTHAFPTASELRDLDPELLAMPRARGRALVGAMVAVADGRVTLEPGTDREETIRSLLDLPGIGPWTASYVALRALGDPDAFLPTDLGVRHALDRLAPDLAAKDQAQLTDGWRPFRSYALHHLWASLDA